ncbi:choline dehydrogenase [Bacteriovoracaceae bacterium]|nr:choline dehydrogenase [Bacteriovoracaceae bacterium]
MTEKYDYIIVGGGSAGCVLAKRLVDANAKVLVLEAGRPDSWWDLFIHMPAALTIPLGNKLYDWCYESDPEPRMDGRKVFHGRGKVLGGSSSINGMIFQRGNPMDFEKWGQIKGLEKWDYAHCLPYFKRMENCLAIGPENGPHPYRGTKGPLALERGPGSNPLFKAFLKSCEEAGEHITDDVNGHRQEGFALFDRNIKNGRRLSAARAYLHPTKRKHPDRLTIVTRALATQVLFDGKKAIGVEYVKSSIGGFSRKTVKAFAGEVILCGGAFNSPQLLQLSGIGPSELLKKHGISEVMDLPGVGKNLQDHLEVYVQHACTQPVSMNPALKWWRKPDVGLQWLLFRKGPASTNHFEAGGFTRSNDQVDYPNLMFHFLPLAVRYDGSVPEGGHGFQVHVGPMYSDVRGELNIVSKDPTVHPSIKFNYLSTEDDRREWVEAIATARKLLSQPALAEFSGGETSPGPDVKTPEQILEWVGKDAETALHPSCTCKMGLDELSVIHPDTMKVHGVEGLRVVDASSMPVITNGNIYAPIVMLAEKAADLILGNTPLPAENVEFYRHRD